MEKEELIEQVELMLSQLHHDIRGVATPVVFVGEILKKNPDPKTQQRGVIIENAMLRLVAILNNNQDQIKELKKNCLETPEEPKF